MTWDWNETKMKSLGHRYNKIKDKDGLLPSTVSRTVRHTVNLFRYHNTMSLKYIPVYVQILKKSK